MVDTPRSVIFSLIYQRAIVFCSFTAFDSSFIKSIINLDKLIDEFFIRCGNIVDHIILNSVLQILIIY